MKTKTCNSPECNEPQPITNFPPDKRCKGGRSNKCRSCLNRIKAERNVKWQWSKDARIPGFAGYMI